MHIDHKKVRIELRGFPNDIKNLIAWCKVNHDIGTYATFVLPQDIQYMPHTGYFQKKVGTWI